jgi:hypothetical protein
LRCLRLAYEFTPAGYTKLPSMRVTIAVSSVW